MPIQDTIMPELWETLKGVEGGRARIGQHERISSRSGMVRYSRNWEKENRETVTGKMIEPRSSSHPILAQERSTSSNANALGGD